MSFLEVPKLPPLVAALTTAANTLGDLEDTDKAAAGLVVEAGRPRTPRRTGRLASATQVSSSGIISNPTSYAAPVHWGWARGSARVAGRPWLLEAVDRNVDQLEDLYAKHTATALERI